MFWEINSKMTTLIVDILNHKHKITANLQPCQNIVLAIWGIFRNKQQFQLVSWWFEPVNHYGLYQGWNKQQNNPFKVLGLLKQKQKNNNDIKKQTLSVTRAETDRLFTTANDVTQRNDVTSHFTRMFRDWRISRHTQTKRCKSNHTDPWISLPVYFYLLCVWVKKKINILSSKLLDFTEVTHSVSLK